MLVGIFSWCLTFPLRFFPTYKVFLNTNSDSLFVEFSCSGFADVLLLFLLVLGTVFSFFLVSGAGGYIELELCTLTTLFLFVFVFF